MTLSNDKQLVVKTIGVHDAYLLDEIKLKKLVKPSGLFCFLNASPARVKGIWRHGVSPSSDEPALTARILLFEVIFQ